MPPVGVADEPQRFVEACRNIGSVERHAIAPRHAPDRWRIGRMRAIAAPTLATELWLYPRDSRVALNGSGLLIVNPPWQTEERVRAWLPELESALAAGGGGGAEVRMLSESPQ